MKEQENQIVIYQTPDKTAVLEVRTDTDTVWLSLDQMSALFERDKSTISRHLKNVFAERELERDMVVAKFATTTPHGAIANKTQSHLVEHYNLDVIISVGYRVRSPRGTQFRQWANTVLKQHLIQGYTINENRLKILGKMLDIVARSSEPEIAGLSNVLRQFAQGLDLLDHYDHQTLAKPKGKSGNWQLAYKDARNFIDSMKFGNESDLFGNERDESFKGTLGAIYQTFSGQDVYTSIQEKAANLLYLTVKNHSFSDGNKRIAAALFVYFLDKNGALFDAQKRPMIDNNALAAVTLMIALSRPDEKEIMCRLVMNMLENSAGDIAVRSEKR